MGLLGERADAVVKRGQRGDERAEGVGDERRRRAQRRERWPEEPCVQPGRQTVHGARVSDNPLGRGPLAHRRAGRGHEGRRRERVGQEARDVRSGERVGDEPLGLGAGEPAAHDHVGRGRLVAPVQPPQRARGPGAEEAEPDVRLHDVVEGLDEDEPPAHPALVLAEELADLGLRQLSRLNPSTTPSPPSCAW